MPFNINFKRIIILAAAVFLLCGCGGGNEEEPQLTEFVTSVTEEGGPAGITLTPNLEEAEKKAAEAKKANEKNADSKDTGEGADEVASGTVKTSDFEVKTAELGNLKGVWVASVKNTDYPREATDDCDSLKKEADDIVSACSDMGITDVFLQVRPASDALYKSDIFPWSRYLTGTDGRAPGKNFDPLEYWIKICHQRGIRIHAWINPYRVTKENDANDSEYNSLSASNPARLHPEYLIKHKGNYYYDPGLPAVRQLVIDGIMEILEDYDVDGIHFDDYFYPSEGGEAFADDASFAAYGSGYSSKEEWRRDNVNKLIKTLGPMIKSAKPGTVFGISPSGIWANSKTVSGGSNTSGLSSYTQLYADTRLWAKENWIDYIAPQIYWEIGYSKADYKTLLDWWSGELAGCDTKLYIGMAAYRTLSSDTSSVWYGQNGIDEIGRQHELNLQHEKVEGEIYYNISALRGNPGLADFVKNNMINR